MVDGLWFVVFRTQSAYAEREKRPKDDVATTARNTAPTPQSSFGQLASREQLDSVEGSHPSTNNQQLTTNNY